MSNHADELGRTGSEAPDPVPQSRKYIKEEDTSLDEPDNQGDDVNTREATSPNQELARLEAEVQQLKGLCSDSIMTNCQLRGGQSTPAKKF